MHDGCLAQSDDLPPFESSQCRLGAEEFVVWMKMGGQTVKRMRVWNVGGDEVNFHHDIITFLISVIDIFRLSGEMCCFSGRGMQA